MTLPRRGVGTALLTLLLLASAAHHTDAHGHIFFPKARQVMADEKGMLNPGAGCPHCMQGGGPGRDPDICGAPGQGGQNVTAMFFGPQATYEAGQVIDIGLYINSQHGGRHSFSICPLDHNQATQACFDLPQHQLVRADGGYADGKRYFYQLSSGWGGKEGNYWLKFRLPSGITCPNGCMMQWNWSGFQSGALACEDPSWDVPGDCGKSGRTNNQTCDPWASWQQCIPRLLAPGYNGVATENFRNCIDILIRPSYNKPAQQPQSQPQQPQWPQPQQPQSQLPLPVPSEVPTPASGPSLPSPYTLPAPEEQDPVLDLDQNQEMDPSGTSSPQPGPSDELGPALEPAVPVVPVTQAASNGTCDCRCKAGAASGCPATRDKARARCMCFEGKLAGENYHADTELYCIGGVWCAAKAKDSYYIKCAARHLFDDVTNTCRPAAEVTCGARQRRM